MNEAARPIITLETDAVALGPLRRDLVPRFHAWINDLQTSRFLRIWPLTLDGEFAWYDGVVKDPDMAFFTIYDRTAGRYDPIGGVDLHAIDRTNRSAELGIMIGELSARGRGLGTEAIRLVCDYGFNALELHSIELMTFGWNVAGQRAYVKAGFREYGRRRQARYFAGRWWDDIHYDLLRSEFQSPVARNILTDGIPLD